MTLIKCRECGYGTSYLEGGGPSECPKCGSSYPKGEGSKIDSRNPSRQPDSPRKGELESALQNVRQTITTAPIPSEPVGDVVILKDGSAVRSRLQRMFLGIRGPFMIDKYRLDRLQSAEVLRDASTVTTRSTSNGEISTRTGSLVGRAVVGGVVAGPFGAVIGGGSAKKSTTSESISSQIQNVDIYMALRFRGEVSPINIQLFDDNVFQQIQACVGQKEWSPLELEYAKAECDLWVNESERRSKLVRHVVAQNEAAKLKTIFAAMAVLVVGFIYIKATPELPHLRDWVLLFFLAAVVGVFGQPFFLKLSSLLRPKNGQSK